MVALGEKFIFACEIVGSIIIGLIFVGMAVTDKSGENAWKMMIAAVFCFCGGLFFAVLYINDTKEREKKRLILKK